jgi:dolichol-phosphate mannosyltransferase
MSGVELSIVVPIYNEEENVPLLLDEIRAAVGPMGIIYEIVAVDDGSRDGSLAALRAAAESHPMLRVVELEQNSGQTAALDAGWRAARGKYVVSLDADLQNDPADIPAMYRNLLQSGADMVIGVRARRKDSAWRRFQSRLGNGVRNWITGDRITDTGCSLKMLRRDCVDRVKLYNGMHRFLPTLLRIEGYRVIEMPVNHRRRRYGTSKYGAANRAVRGLVDCLAVRWMRSRSVRYRIRNAKK